MPVISLLSLLITVGMYGCMCTGLSIAIPENSDGGAVCTWAKGDCGREEVDGFGAEVRAGAGASRSAGLGTGGSTRKEVVKEESGALLGPLTGIDGPAEDTGTLAAMVWVGAPGPFTSGSGPPTIWKRL